MRHLLLKSVLATALCAPLAWAADKEGKSEEASPAFEQFDPQAYTCNQFLKDLEMPSGQGEAAGMALIWLHGFHSAVYGTDEVGALDEKAIGELAKTYGEYCKEHSKENFSRASKKLTEEEEG
jgi:hypothetical protein